MKVVPSYYVKRNGKFVWLSQGIQPESTDEIVEERMVAVASEGKVLSDHGDIIGSSCWVKDVSNVQLAEIDEPIEPDIVEEEPEE